MKAGFARIGNLLLAKQEQRLNDLEVRMKKLQDSSPSRTSFAGKSHSIHKAAILLVPFASSGKMIGADQRKRSRASASTVPPSEETAMARHTGRR
jgi:hypothetical protein